MQYLLNFSPSSPLPCLTPSGTRGDPCVVVEDWESQQHTNTLMGRNPRALPVICNSELTGIGLTGRRYDAAFKPGEQSCSHGCHVKLVGGCRRVAQLVRALP